MAVAVCTFEDAEHVFAVWTALAVVTHQPGLYLRPQETAGKTERVEHECDD